jgi:hypothetical protein
MLNTFFFDYMPLKWRRLLRSLILIPFVILLLGTIINFFDSMTSTYGGRFLPFVGEDKIIYGTGKWIDGVYQNPPLYPGGWTSNKIISWATNAGGGLLLITLSIYFIITIFLSWSFSKKGLSCKYSPIGFIR